MTTEQAIYELKLLYVDLNTKGAVGEALEMAIEALQFMSEYHQSNIESYAHDMGVSLEQAELELRIQPKTAESGSVDSEMPEIKTDRTTSGDLISRQDAIDAIVAWTVEDRPDVEILPSAQPEIIRCKDCKYWRRQTNYAGALLTFGFCESEDMWASLYGETYEVAHIDTDDNHYCGYAERRTDEID